VARHEAALHRQLLDGLKARSGIQLLGSPAVALACFTVDGIHHSDLAQLLSEQGIAVRAGQHCAMPLLASLGVSGAVRVSLGLYNDGSDLVRFFRALDQALELLQ
jgi:cysteine sulfinate desulfinase